jgi:hypothetical protein
MHLINLGPEHSAKISFFSQIYPVCSFVLLATENRLIYNAIFKSLFVADCKQLSVDIFLNILCLLF